MRGRSLLLGRGRLTPFGDGAFGRASHQIGPRWRQHAIGGFGEGTRYVDRRGAESCRIRRPGGSLDPRTAEACCAALPRFAGSTANVLGSTYNKQIDVGLSSWMTGPEILISTKTMGSSFGKNLSNRFEEAYGDAKNLKGRHPLATLGFFFLVNSSIVDEPRIFAKAVTMLEKLRMEDDAYDATCLLLVDWGEGGHLTVSRENDRVPLSLSALSFFEEVVRLTLLRAAPEAHELARLKRIAASA